MKTTERTTHQRVRHILIVFTTIVAALGAVSLVPAVVVPDMFGPPATHGDALTTLAVIALMAFPLLCALSIASAWLLWRKDRDTAACAAMVLPPFSGLLLLIVLLWLSY